MEGIKRCGITGCKKAAYSMVPQLCWKHHKEKCNAISKPYPDCDPAWIENLQIYIPMHIRKRWIDSLVPPEDDERQQQDEEQE